jgi:hypothetical protein
MRLAVFLALFPVVVGDLVGMVEPPPAALLGPTGSATAGETPKSEVVQRNGIERKLPAASRAPTVRQSFRHFLSGVFFAKAWRGVRRSPFPSSGCPPGILALTSSVDCAGWQALPTRAHTRPRHQQAGRFASPLPPGGGATPLRATWALTPSVGAGPSAAYARVMKRRKRPEGEATPCLSARRLSLLRRADRHAIRPDEHVGGLVWSLRRRRSGPTDGGSASPVAQ